MGIQCLHARTNSRIDLKTWASLIALAFTNILGQQSQYVYVRGEKGVVLLTGITRKKHQVPMIIEFSGKIIYWRGPAPFFFVPIPHKESEDIKAISNVVSYGWGVIPVQVKIGKTEWDTSLFPKDGVYLVPIKAAIRKAESLNQDDIVALQLSIAI